jgi:aspartyl-tRNA(Asn)/glutamyl-tRNA(Gln) amidotransferase subunit C
MKIDQENLQKIAHLARLNFDAQAGEKMSADLSQVLAPLTNMSAEVNALRTDVVGVQLTQEQALKNAPQQENGFFSVPKVME